MQCFTTEPFWPRTAWRRPRAWRTSRRLGASYRPREFRCSRSAEKSHGSSGTSCSRACSSRAKRFLTTVVSAEAQRVLSKVKGCISPRTDMNDAGATAIQRQKAELLRRGDLALALSGIVPKQFHDDVNWALIDMAKQRSIKPA